MNKDKEKKMNITRLETSGHNGDAFGHYHEYVLTCVSTTSILVQFTKKLVFKTCLATYFIIKY